MALRVATPAVAAVFGMLLFASAHADDVSIMIGGIEKQIYLPAVLAEKLGYFDTEGLNVTLLSEPAGVEAADEMLAKLHINDPLLDIALQMEAAALNDPYFIERKLYPNVDFYSGIILRAMGIPVNMFTVMFAMGRMPGWIANWKEIHDNPKSRIYRPRQIYTGNNVCDYVPIEQR